MLAKIGSTKRSYPQLSSSNDKIISSIHKRSRIDYCSKNAENSAPTSKISKVEDSKRENRCEFIFSCAQ